MAKRYQAQVDRLDCPWGEVFDPGQIEAALKAKRLQAGRIGACRDLHRRFAAGHP